ncbi:hypothetical protein [Nonomuraea sp. KM88]|uniref:hypothetical protein n=1 Tax=Nonomuraea sp. KM88 TaxID=3457427 RepID=UPI003FCE5976
MAAILCCSASATRASSAVRSSSLRAVSRPPSATEGGAATCRTGVPASRETRPRPISATRSSSIEERDRSRDSASSVAARGPSIRKR